MIALSPRALRLALLTHRHEIAFDAIYALAHLPAIRFELRFTFTAAHTDATGLPRQVTPEAREAREQMLELREFDLKLAFPRASTLRKNVEDQRGAIQDFDLEDFFQVAGLRRGKFIVKDGRVHAVLFAERGELASLALADVSGRITRLDFLDSLAHDFTARAARQLGEFVERLAEIFGVVGFQFHTDKEDPFGACGSGLD